MTVWKRSLQILNQNKILSLIGMATRARKVVSGEYMTENKVKSGGAFLVVVAKDASDNTKKMFSDMCQFYELPMYEYGTKEELGHAMGKDVRASLAITEEGFAKALTKLLDS